MQIAYTALFIKEFSHILNYFSFYYSFYLPEKLCDTFIQYKKEGKNNSMYTISAKKIKLQQRINKIKEQEVKIKIQERKQRVSRLLKLGELIEKAELIHLTPSQLYGAFLSLKEVETQKIQEWDQKGSTALNKNTHSTVEKIALSVKLLDGHKSEIKQKLKALGLKWNDYRQEWEGLAHKEAVDQLVSASQGIVNKL